MVRSFDPDATEDADGDQSNAYTSSSCPGSVVIAFLVFFIDHNFTVLSFDPDTKKLLSGDHAT